MKTLRPKVEKIYRDIGKEIAAERHRQGVSQEWLAKRAKVSRAHIANMERGEQRIWPHQLAKIAKALNKSTRFTLGGTGIRGDDFWY